MNWKGPVGLVALAIVIAILVVPSLFSVSSDDSRSAYSEDWDGMSRAREEANQLGYDAANINTSPLALTDTDPQDTILMVIGMDRAYGELEERALDQFMDEGGTLVLLDDAGYGSDYAKRHDLNFKPRQVNRESFDRNQSFIPVDAAYGGANYSLLLNVAYALEDLKEGSTATPLITCFDCYIDLNRDGRIDVEDSISDFVLGIEQPIGVNGGKLILLADSGVFLNDMLDRAQNFAFLQAIWKSSISGDGVVIFDESRKDATLAEMPILVPQKGLLTLLRGLPIVGGIFVLGLVGLLFLARTRTTGLPNWVHRFRPGKSVEPEIPRDEDDLLVNTLELYKEVSSAKNDPALERAMQSPEKVSAENRTELLQQIANSLSLQDSDWTTPRVPSPETSGE